MSKTIAVCNQKGGVGKTTTAVNLSASLALLGAKVILIDLDPQANATGGLGIEKELVEKSIYEVILDGLPAEQSLLPTKIENLKLIPSHGNLSGAEVELVPLERREGRLKEAIKPLGPLCDLILIDSPPSLGLLTVNALTASDSVLIPLQCEYYALEGLAQLLSTVKRVQGGLNRALAIEGFLLTMADFRTKLTGDVIQEVRRHFGSKVYEVVVPRSIRLSEAPSHGLPVALYDPDSTGAKAYHSLAEKIQWRQDDRSSWIRPGDSSADSRGGPDSSRGGDQGPPAVDPSESVSAPSDPR
ncbi:MAG: ParA family protein [Candidatus Omnitrophica bacterium]|nr:ParA family protein [Candidatus Omnitrophota bacterium]